MEFTLTPDDAAALRHLASIEPLEARRYLQDRPDLARRMTSWPPEIRIEVGKILYRSFPEETRLRMQERRQDSSNLLELLGGSG